MSEPTEGLAVRIRHRLRWVESHHDRKLFVEVLTVLEGPDFVPKVPHPDGTGDPANPANGLAEGARTIEATPEAVIGWLAEHGVKMIPWQIIRLNRL